MTNIIFIDIKVILYYSMTNYPNGRWIYIKITCIIYINNIYIL